MGKGEEVMGAEFLIGLAALTGSAAQT